MVLDKSAAWKWLKVIYRASASVVKFENEGSKFENEDQSYQSFTFPKWTSSIDGQIGVKYGVLNLYSH